MKKVNQYPPPCDVDMREAEQNDPADKCADDADDDVDQDARAGPPCTILLAQPAGNAADDDVADEPMPVVPCRTRARNSETAMTSIGISLLSLAKPAAGLVTGYTRVRVTSRVPNWPRSA